MKKKSAVLITLFIIPLALSLQLTQIDSHKAEEDIKSFHSDGKTHFIVSENGLTRKYIQRFSPKGDWIKNPVEGSLPETFLNEKYLAVGRTISGPELRVYNRDGSLKMRKDYPLSFFTKDISMFKYNNSTFFSYTADKKLHGRFDSHFRLFNDKGEKVTSINSDFYSPRPENQLEDIDNDTEPEILLKMIGDNGVDLIKAVDLEGNEEWRSGRSKATKNARYIEGKGVLVWWNNAIELREGDTGDRNWIEGTSTEKLKPLFLDDYFVYSNSTHLLYRDYHGKLFRSSKINEKVKSLHKFPEKNILAGKQGENLSFFSLKGEKLGSKMFNDLNHDIRFTQYDSGKKEMVLATGDNLRVFKLNEGLKLDDLYAPNRYGFVGDDRNILKLVAMNRTVFIGDDKEDFKAETDRKLIEVGGSIMKKTLKNPNERLNSANKSFYVKDREKAVYVAALASRNNATITFEKENADKDFTNYSIEQLQEKFIKEFKPHHIAVVDLDSDKGLLASYMAVRQGVMPVDFDQEYSYPGKDSIDVNKQNRYNSVIQLERKIEQSFTEIGNNRNTVWKTRYITLLDAPRKIYSDPADKIIIDGEDGSWFSSDLEYGNLNKDSFIEAGVGRYPESTELSSKIYDRSLIRNTEKQAIVSSEYMTQLWPKTLSEAGAGLRYGTAMEHLFEKQGFETTHLVEYRSDPVDLLMNLLPVSIKGFLQETDDIESRLSKYLKATTATAFKNALRIIRGLHYLDQILKMFYEFQWSTTEFEPEKGVQKLKTMDIPNGKTPNEIIQKGVMEVLYAAVWPDRHPRLNSTSLKNRMKDKDIIYYRGVGNSDNWTIPPRQEKEYRGEFKPSEIPELRNSIVWDNSDLAGSLDSEMRQKFLEKGASSYLGFSGLNYPSYTSSVGNKYFREGKTLGSSLKKGINILRASDLLYPSESLSRYGVREKTSDSLVMYGNPEMRKDPIDRKHFNIERSCNGTTCTLEAILKPDYRVVKTGNGSIVEFNTTEYIKDPGKPITPLYHVELPIPGNKIKQVYIDSLFENRSEVKLPKSSLMRLNKTSSRSGTLFPKKVSNYHKDSGSIKLIHSGTRSYPNNTSLLQKAVFEITYSPKAVIDLEKENKTVYSEINSDEEFNGTLFYNIGNRSVSKDIRVNKGIQQLDLFDLREGSGYQEVKARLYDDQLVSSDSEKFRFKELIKIQYLGPEKITLQNPTELKFNISNPNSYELEEKLSFKAGNGLRLGLMESFSRKLSLKPKNSRLFSFRVVGYSSGQSNFTINNYNYSIDIKNTKPVKTVFKPEKVLTGFENRKYKISKSIRSHSQNLNLKTVRGSLEISTSPEKSSYILKTENFTVKNLKTNGKEVKTVKNRDNRLEVKIKNGLKTSSGNMDKESFNYYTAILDREIGKFDYMINKNNSNQLPSSH